TPGIAVEKEKNRPAARRRRIPGDKSLPIAGVNVLNANPVNGRCDDLGRWVIDEAIEVERERANASRGQDEQNRDGDQDAFEHHTPSALNAQQSIAVIPCRAEANVE